MGKQGATRCRKDPKPKEKGGGSGDHFCGKKSSGFVGVGAFGKAPELGRPSLEDNGKVAEGPESDSRAFVADAGTSVAVGSRLGGGAVCDAPLAVLEGRLADTRAIPGAMAWARERSKSWSNWSQHAEPAGMR